MLNIQESFLFLVLGVCTYIFSLLWQTGNLQKIIAFLYVICYNLCLFIVYANLYTYGMLIFLVSSALMLFIRFFVNIFHAWYNYNRALLAYQRPLLDEVVVSLGMWGVINNNFPRVHRQNRIQNRGVHRPRAGRAAGPFPPGDPRHVPNAFQIALNLGIPQLDPNDPPLEPERAPEDKPPVPHWYRANRHKIKNAYLPADKPKNRCTFTTEEVNNNVFNYRSTLFDPCGSPFCGLTALTLAANKKPDVEKFLELCKYTSPQLIGTNIFLKDFAHNLGFNLRIQIPIVVDGQEDDVNNFDYVCNPYWKWVILVVVEQDGSFCEALPGDPVRQVKHCFMVIDSTSQVSNLEVPLVVEKIASLREFVWGFIISVFVLIFVKFLFYNIISFSRFELVGEFYHDLMTVCLEILKLVLGSIPNWVVDLTIFMVTLFDECVWLFLVRRKFGFRYSYRFLRTVYNETDVDNRVVRERRDQIEEQDKYAVFIKEKWLTLDDRLVCVLPNFNFTFLTVESYPIIMVSVLRARQLYKEMQCAPTDSLNVAMMSVLKGNYLNTNENIPELYTNTIEYVQWVISRNKHQTVDYTKFSVAYNAQGHLSYIGNLNIVAINQLAVSVGRVIWTNFMDDEINIEQIGITPNVCVPQMNNGFKKFNVKSLKIKQDKVVAYCPLGSLITDEGQLGPGNLCVTSPYSTLSALAGRSMVKIPVEVLDFYEFAQKTVRNLMDLVDCSHLCVDEDEEACYRANNKGKRSQKYVDSKLTEYHRVLQGKKNRKFYENSCFVKFEDSSKVVKGVSRIRPRLIMTMSDFYSIVLSPLIFSVHVWNDSFISKYQVKNMSPEDFVSKVASFCDRPHIVTDYSAFESSVSYIFKLVETLFAELLLTKLRMFKTLSHFRNLNKFGRELKCDIGTFVISSRCSGDYFTSTFNCLINFLINAYSCHIKGLNHMDLIVEGDDGLTLPHQIDDQLINSMGFGFSSNVLGSVPGDVDFLRKRWLYDNSYVSIGRALKNIFWVNSQTKLTHKRQLTIIRAKALSYYFSSPGCPILTEAINYILKKTSGLQYFKGLEKHMSYNDTFDVKKIGKNYGTLKVDENMRGPLAYGATGFPPIPVAIQLVLEENFKKGNFYVGSLLDDYDDIYATKLIKNWHISNPVLSLSPEVEEVKKICSCSKEEIVQYVLKEGLFTQEYLEQANLL